MYKKFKNNFNEEITNMIFRYTDNTYIPFNLANRDYQEYLKWLEEGNTPLPAEEVGLQPTADEINE
jgi:hypothetical protein